MQQPKLFTPIQIKSIKFKNRIWLSPMCQYSSSHGYPAKWHLVHLGSRAVGGAGLVMVEATAVSPEGRISPNDCGIWSDDHIPAFKRLSDFLDAQDSTPGIQLAHAGRKASQTPPWLGSQSLSISENGWQIYGPSSIPFHNNEPAPIAMTHRDIAKVIEDFEMATRRVMKAGFKVLELHMAHGYLIHQFLSPLSNTRDDSYGGSLENRMRLGLEVASAVRAIWPQELPLFVRISATDWVEGPRELNCIAETKHHQSEHWDIAASLIFSQKLKERGIDLIDCSSGGILPKADIPRIPGYQVPFAATIRHDCNILTAAVGMITDPIQAETILQEEQADAVFIAREFLRNPYWPMHAARTLNVSIEKPKQYERAY